MCAERVGIVEQSGDFGQARRCRVGLGREIDGKPGYGFPVGEQRPQPIETLHIRTM